MKRMMLVGVLLTVAAFGCNVVGQTLLHSDWTPGTYWTYQTDVVEHHDGTRTQGTVTFLVLTDEAAILSNTWLLAVITQWYDATEIMITASHSEALSVVPWRRWPQIIDYLPPKQLPDWDLDFRRSIASQGIPSWIYSTSTVSVGTSHPPVAETELIMLSEGYGPVETPEGSFDAARVDYSWTQNILGHEAGRNEGAAWWAQDAGWWVHAEGQELADNGRPERTYEITLSDYGVLNAEEMKDRLTAAVSSTAAIDAEFAAGMREWLHSVIGINLEE